MKVDLHILGDRLIPLYSSFEFGGISDVGPTKSLIFSPGFS